MELKDLITDDTGSVVAVPSYRVPLCKLTSKFLSVYTVNLYTTRLHDWLNKLNKVLVCSDSLY